MNSLFQHTNEGIYCPGGNFYIDPHRPVPRAVITHAHADHARWGSQSYLCTRECKPLLQARLGPDADIQTLAYGEKLKINGVSLSLHPAGHVLGSAQVRIDAKGQVGVVSGDYKTAEDPTCAPLETLQCHIFISESTFGLPIFKWPSTKKIIADIQSWWRENQAMGRASILFAYALGKAQRILTSLDPSQGPILTHGAVEKINHCYRAAGIPLPRTHYLGDIEDRSLLKKALIVAPPSADHPAWLKRFPRRSRAFASGWMRIRGNRRRRAVDRGFILSDHSDWNGLVETIKGTGAETIRLTHGYADEMARWLQETGYDAAVAPTHADDDADGEEVSS